MKTNKFKSNNDRINEITREMKTFRKRIINKLTLGVFLTIAISALIMKLVDGILLDLGYYHGEFNWRFWEDQDWVAATKDPLHPNLIKATMLSHHPNFFWLLTQFTWITTLLIIVFLFFRFFMYDQNSLPRWIKWIMRQRTLSLMTMYDSVVAIVFWATMFQGFSSSFNPDLFGLEMTITIAVHAVIPTFILVYSFIYLVRDRRASLLKELFVMKGMIYPTIYMCYYLVVSISWYDPYPITNIHQDIVGNLWKIPVTLLGIYILLGLMVLLHNFVLIKFNKKYDLKNDYEIKIRMKQKIEKIKRKTTLKKIRAGEIHKMD